MSSLVKVDFELSFSNYEYSKNGTTIFMLYVFVLSIFLVQLCITVSPLVVLLNDCQRLGRANIAQNG